MTQTRKRRPYAARVPMEQRREQLLDAALQVIDRDGYDGVSVDAIAKQAGVTRPVVYGAFDGLAPLLGTLLDRQQQRALDQLYDALPLDALAGSPVDLIDVADVVERAVPALHAMLLADPLTWRAILQADGSAPEVMRERIAADRDRVRATVALMAAAVLPAGTDTEVIAHGVLALLEQFGRLVLAAPDSFTAERLTAVARDLIGAWVR